MENDPSANSPDELGDITQEEAAAMMRTVLNLFQRWKVSDEQAAVLLGKPRNTDFDRWTREEVGALSMDTAGRLCDLLSIHRSLRTIFPEVDRAYAWVSKPNEAFGGRSALDHMLGGRLDDLKDVRQYLERELR